LIPCWPPSNPTSHFRQQHRLNQPSNTTFALSCLLLPQHCLAHAWDNFKLAWCFTSKTFHTFTLRSTNPLILLRLREGQHLNEVAAAAQVAVDIGIGKYPLILSKADCSTIGLDPLAACPFPPKPAGLSSPYPAGPGLCLTSLSLLPLPLPFLRPSSP
jgi:hypothetical protein